MKSKLLALLLLAGGSVFAGPRVAVGFGVGVGVAPAYGYVAPVPAPVYVAPAPVVVGAYPYGVGYGWRAGYWAHPYARYGVGPRYYGRGYVGHWRR